MSTRDFANDLHRSASTLSLDKILYILQSLQKRTPKIEDDELLRYFMYAPLVDLHNTEISIDVESLTLQEHNAHFALNSYKITTSYGTKTYPLSHDYSNAGGITLNTPGKAEGTKFHGGAFTNGISSIDIENHELLYPDDAITYHVWAYLKSGLGSFRNMICGNAHCLHTNLSNKITFDVHFSNVDNITLSNTLDIVEGWYHIVATAKRGSQKLYVNNKLVDSDTIPDDLKVGTGLLRLFAKANNTNKLADGEGLAWVSIINGFADDDWVNKAYNGVLDFSVDMKEITTFPFVGDLKPQPNATTGLFYTDRIFDVFGYAPNDLTTTIEYEFHNSSQVREWKIKRRINRTGQWRTLASDSTARQKWETLTSSLFIGFSYEDRIERNYCPSGRAVTGYACHVKTYTRTP